MPRFRNYRHRYRILRAYFSALSFFGALEVSAISGPVGAVRACYNRKKPDFTAVSAFP
jgi:hypothetical protein